MIRKLRQIKDLETKSDSMPVSLTHKTRQANKILLVGYNFIHEYI